MSHYLYDPLTGLLTPFHFYESAKRIKAWADRRDQDLSLIHVDLISLSEDEIVSCARQLNRELRGGDILARMAEHSFVLLLLGDDEGAGHLIFRLSNSVKPRLRYSKTNLKKEESLVQALGRLGI